MPKQAKINVKEVGQDLLTFNDRNTIRIRILSCESSTTTIIDARTNKEKKVDSLEMKVIDLDDNKEKGFNTLSKRLQNALNDINESEGLIDNELRIERIGTGFQTKWNVESILSKPSKATK